MDLFNEINCGILHDAKYTALMSFIFGFLFAGISFGLVYVIIFIVVTEFLYFGYLDVNDRYYNFDDRTLIIITGLLGFLLGRFFLGQDDHYEDFKKFQTDYHEYGRNLGWFDVKATRRRMKRKKIEKWKKERDELCAAANRNRRK